MHKFKSPYEVYNARIFWKTWNKTCQMMFHVVRLDQVGFGNNPNVAQKMKDNVPTHIPK